LRLGYGGEAVVAGVDLEVRRGDYWFLLGGNGTGKTTLLRAVLGLIAPIAGELHLGGGAAARQQIGYIPQRCAMNPTLRTTVREFVSLGLVGLRLGRSERARRLDAALGLTGLAGAARRGYHVLSGGQRQRALVARALIREPSLLILDEPTNGLDPTGEQDLLDLLARLHGERGLTMLFVTHQLDIAARFASHVALFHEGRVSAGPVGEVLTEENLTRIFGRPVSLGLDRGALHVHTLGGHC
jgi:ABC-type Mn2+/Zn2+ transport system ATPase subunit